jgi:protein TonB
MKTKFILPATLALTLHAFLLFGMSGKPPIMSLTPDLPRPDEPKPTLDPDDTLRIESDNNNPLEEPLGPIASRREEILIEPPPGDHWTIPPLPRIVGDPSIKTIPTEWEKHLDPGNHVSLPPPRGLDLDRVPRARLQAAPEYPSAMRSRGMEGTVVVEFFVDETGSVYSTTVLHATNPGFEEAALRAVSRWKFESGCKDGRKVRFRMSVPVVFKIEAD